MMKNRLIVIISLTTSLSLTPVAYAGKGMLTITTDPGGAKIYINGKRKGTSPKEKGQSFAIKLDEGEYSVTAYGQSRSPLWVNMGKESEVFVGADSRQPLSLKLKWQLNPDLPGSQLKRVKELMAITDNYRSQANREQDFVPQGDGTVIDKRMGLQWMRCSLGQTWTETMCSGEANKYDWQQANAQTRNFAGYSDWRLPTHFELETLIYCSSGKDKGREGENRRFYLDWCAGNYQRPTIGQKAFPDTKDGFYWSSSPHADYDSNAWGVDFYYGYDDFSYKDNNHFVRLVRGL